VKKSLIVAALALVLVSSLASAEYPYPAPMYGLKGGLNLANLRGDDVKDTSARTGIVIGGFLEYPLGQMLSLQGELLYAMKGAKWDLGDVEATLKFGYVEVPFLFKLRIPTDAGVRPFVLAGPGIAFKTSAKVEFDNVDTESSIERNVENTKGTDVGLILGGGVGIPMGSRLFSLEARYEMGLMDIFDVDPTVNVRHGVISILAGIAF